MTLFLVGSAFAQNPNPEFHFPEPTESPDGSNGTCAAYVYINGIQVTTVSELEVAFFDENNVCRQRNFVQHFDAINEYLFWSVCYGAAGQTLTFKFYDHTLGKSNEDLGYTCTTSFTYIPNIALGNPDHPYEIYFWGSSTCTFTNTSGNSWATEANWMPRVPLSIDNAIIDGACLVEEGTVPTYKSLTIKDGAQFFDANGTEHEATVEKNIAAYTGERDNYYFIASPIGNPFSFEETGMLTGEYDLYFFQIDGIDENNQKKEWQNYEFYQSFGYLESFSAPFHGYLYANNTDKILRFTGNLDMTTSTVHTLKGANTYCGNERFPGFNLIGNNYACNATVTGNNKVLGYYTINENDNRSNVIAALEPIVAPCTALFVSISEPNNFSPAYITFTPSISAEANVRKSSNNICIEVSNSNGKLIDRAYIEISEGEGMKKFNLNEDATQLYFRRENQDYAIIRTEDTSQLPLYFETKERGEYTLKVNMGNMSCKHLHLIDNITGADINLNATPSYTFLSKQGDYVSRFRIVFEGAGIEDNSTEDFVIVEGNRFIIPEVENGSILAIIDMMGRIISSQTINGSFDQEMNLANGMYVVRLNGDSQKVVIR